MDTSLKLPKASQLISEAWKIYRERFATFFLLALPLLLWNIINISLNLSYQNFYTVICSFFGSFIMAIFTQAAIFGNLANNGSFSDAFKTFPKYLWTNIIAGLIVATGMILFIIPGVIWVFWFIFSNIIVASEKEFGVQALVKSREYMRGHAWVIIRKTLAFGIVVAVPVLILSLLSKQQPYFLYVQSAYSAIILPLSLAYLYNLYQHVKSIYPITNPLSPGTGFKIAACFGVLVIAAVIAAGVWIGSAIPEYLSMVQHFKDSQNTHYVISPEYLANNPDGQRLANSIILKLRVGFSETEIRASLAQVGWSQSDIDKVFQAITIQK